MSRPSHAPFRPSLERFEPRLLLALTSSTAYVSYAFNTFVAQLRSIELHSRATPDQFRALRDDVRSISSSATLGGLSLQDAQAKAVAATIQIDRAPLDGWLNDAGWSQISGRLTANLQALGVPQPLIAKTLNDSKAIAASVGLSADGFASFNKHWNQLHQDLQYYNTSTHFADPALYYTQHLRGFFRGWAIQRSADGAKLTADARTLAGPGGSVVIARDTKLLESLGAQVPSASNAALHDAFVTAFASGAPTAAALDSLRMGINAALGSVVAARRESTVSRLLADAPSFFQAAGSTPANVRTIADDIQIVVDDGGGESGLNPFRIQVFARPNAG